MPWDGLVQQLTDDRSNLMSDEHNTGFNEAGHLYVDGYRVHHGAVGIAAAAIGAATGNVPLAAAGIAAAIHDRADVREWVPGRVDGEFKKGF